MYTRSAIVNKLIRIRNIKIALIMQSLITTIAIIYMMLQASNLDQASRWEIERAVARCRGCCVIKKASVIAITNEPHLSEKLHKFSRAIRDYEIPAYILKILHDGERKIEEFENELQRLKQEKLRRVSQLQESYIEEDTTTNVDLTPRSKPIWKKTKRIINTVEKSVRS